MWEQRLVIVQCVLFQGQSILQVLHFPFPTPPEAEELLAAQKCLVALSALHPASHPSTPLGLTALGRAMSRYPITPRHARMLLQARWFCFFSMLPARHGCCKALPASHSNDCP